MSQKSHLLNLTTKAKKKQCKYISQKNTTYYLFMPKCMMGKRDHDVDIYLNNICKKKKKIQVKYTYMFKL